MTGFHPRPPAHHNAPLGTSAVAADAIARHAPTVSYRVLEYFRSRGAEGATDDEGERALGLKSQSFTPRRGELARKKLLIDSGRRRLTSSGRPAAVWVTPEHAPAAAPVTP